MDSDYQEEILEAQEAEGWGTLTPINDQKFHAFNLRGIEDINFGRIPACHYVFDKVRHNLSDNEYHNISKVHFTIKKTEDSVVLNPINTGLLGAPQNGGGGGTKCPPSITFDRLKIY